MKVLLINRVDFSDPGNHGLLVKMQGQCKALENLGHHVATASLFKNTIQLDRVDGVRQAPNSTSKLHLYHQVFYRYLQRSLQEIKPDVVILRFHLFHRTLLRFLRKCEALGIYTMIEFPTFPFRLEFTSVSQRLRLALHRYFLQSVLTNVNSLFHYGVGERIYQRPSLKLTNGIDIDRFELIESTDADEVFTLIAVGKWQYWHGLDRLLDSVAMRKEGDIRLLVVGMTPHLKSLQTSAMHASPSIEFLGSLSGDNLTAAFSRADVGVGALGLHRKDLAEASPLKHREYCARGLPFIYASRDQDFDGCDFIKNIPATDDPIDLDEIKEFCLQARRFSRADIRAYARQNLGWEDRMQKIMELVS